MIMRIKSKKVKSWLWPVYQLQLLVASCSARFQFHVSKIEIIDTKCILFLLLVNGAEPSIYENPCAILCFAFQQLHRFIFGIESKDSQDERGTLSLSWQHLHESRYICHCLHLLSAAARWGKITYWVQHFARSSLPAWPVRKLLFYMLSN